jgi:hypothetical protein
MTTVTIQVEDELVERARRLAASHNLTVAEMLHRLLRVAVQDRVQDGGLPPITAQSRGILPPTTDEQRNAALDEHRRQKYGS